MGLKLMAISQNKAFFQTYINEINSHLPEVQFEGLIFIRVTKFVLKNLEHISDGVKNRVAYKKGVQ